MYVQSRQTPQWLKRRGALWGGSDFQFVVAVLKSQSCVHYNENGDWFRHPCPPVFSVPPCTRHLNVDILRVIIKYPKGPFMCWFHSLVLVIVQSNVPQIPFCDAENICTAFLWECVSNWKSVCRFEWMCPLGQFCLDPLFCSTNLDILIFQGK